MGNELFEKMYFAVIEANKGAEWESYKATIEAMYKVAQDEKIVFDFNKAHERFKQREGRGATFV